MSNVLLFVQRRVDRLQETFHKYHPADIRSLGPDRFLLGQQLNILFRRDAAVAVNLALRWLQMQRLKVDPVRCMLIL